MRKGKRESKMGVDQDEEQKGADWKDTREREKVTCL